VFHGIIFTAYAHDDDRSLVCLNMQIKIWNLGTWIPLQISVVNA
jgi:hypothetical protein